jgi:hypothetical protein
VVVWSKGEFKAVLEAKALLRRGASSKAEEAALLYARTQGWTEEEGISIPAAEAALDALLDEIDPDDWEAMQKAAAHIGDATFKGVVRYAVKRIAERNAEDLKAFSKHAPDREKRDSDRS